MRIHGGLGNQLFQYAYIYALAKKNNTDFRLDLSAYEEYKVRKPELSHFKIQPKFAKKWEIPFYERYNRLKQKNIFIRKFFNFCKKLNPYDYQEKSKGFDPDFTQINHGYIRGYFQTEKYFKNYKSELIKLFSFTPQIEYTINNFLKKNHIKNLNEYVAISIRRGDFAREKEHFLIPIEFYLNAKKQYFPEKKVLIFSDDQERCKQEFKKIWISPLLTYELWPIEQLCLMTHCKNFIISNSTFSRRGAYLSNFDDKIIVRPLLKFDQEHKGKHYMRDHYPPERIAHAFWF